MNKLNKHLLVLTSLLLSINLLNAQEQVTHEVSGWIGGGLSTLNYKQDYGKQTDGFGTHVGLGYNYHLSQHWSLGTGVEFALYNAKSELDAFSDSYLANDGKTDFNFKASTDRYKEQQHSYYINFPIVTQFQTHVNDVHQFYISGGIKIGIPLSSKFKIKNGNFKTSGHYEQAGVQEIKDNQADIGFGNFNFRNKKDNFKVKTAIVATFETGMKWRKDYGKALYTGIYVDYGLNDIRKYSDKKLVEYNSKKPSDIINNSITSSQWSMNDKRKNMTKKVLPISAGIKIRYSFSFD